jgi:hypothetical protein
MRKKYEADLSEIFNTIEEENRYIGMLLDKTNVKTKSQVNYLDYIKWR